MLRYLHPINRSCYDWQFILYKHNKPLRWLLRWGSPLTFPNREVKPNCADGTAVMWESMSPPSFIKRLSEKIASFFCSKMFYGLFTRCISYENLSVSGCSGILFLKNNTKKDITKHTTWKETHKIKVLYIWIWINY